MAERRYTSRDPAVTSAIMSSVRGTNNKAEVALRKVLWRRGLRYRLYNRHLPGRPDLTFSASRVTVFVDGDFWHGRALLEGGKEALEHQFRPALRQHWVRKITRNVGRDHVNREQLRAAGWTVVRVWESEIKADLEAAADRVEHVVRRQRGSSP